MATRRVFVIWSHPLFHESMRRLMGQPGVEWVGATSDRAAAPGQIANLKPDTILVEEAEGGGLAAETLGILEAAPPDVRVIRLSLATNELSLYHRKQRTVGQVEDLLRLIQND